MRDQHRLHRQTALIMWIVVLLVSASFPSSSHAAPLSQTTLRSQAQNATVCPNSEIESNDTFQSANDLGELSQAVCRSGKLEHANEADWYRFRVAKPG